MIEVSGPAPQLHHQDCRRIHIDNWRIHTVQQDMGFDKGFDFYPPLTDSDVDKVSTGLPDNVVILTTSLKYSRGFSQKRRSYTSHFTVYPSTLVESLLPQDGLTCTILSSPRPNLKKATSESLASPSICRNSSFRASIYNFLKSSPVIYIPQCYLDVLRISVVFAPYKEAFVIALLFLSAIWLFVGSLW